MNIDTIIPQLRTLCPVFAGNVAGAAAYANGVSDQVWLPLPAAYVVPMDESAGDNRSSVGLWQEVTERISVIVVFNNATDPADRRGQAVAAQFRQVRADIFAALLNWRPDWDPNNTSTNIETRGIYYAGGQLIDFDRARLQYRWDFALDTTITDSDGWQQASVPLVDIQTTLQDQTSGETLATYDTPLTSS